MPNQYQTKLVSEGKIIWWTTSKNRIARALYHNPEVLILDEATSALDNLTEQAVMDAINNLGKNITIILIAHRLSTVKNCDKIFLLDKGQLKAKGKFEELIQNFEEYKHTKIFLEPKN